MPSVRIHLGAGAIEEPAFHVAAVIHHLALLVAVAGALYGGVGHAHAVIATQGADGVIEVLVQRHREEPIIEPGLQRVAMRGAEHAPGRWHRACRCSLVDGSHSSIFQRAPFVSLKNPKRMTRMPGREPPDRADLRPAPVRRSRLRGRRDHRSPASRRVLPRLVRLRHAGPVLPAYLGYIEGKKKAMAEAAGIILPGAPQVPSSLHRG